MYDLRIPLMKIFGKPQKNIILFFDSEIIRTGLLRRADSTIKLIIFLCYLFLIFFSLTKIFSLLDGNIIIVTKMSSIEMSNLVILIQQNLFNLISKNQLFSFSRRNKISIYDSIFNKINNTKGYVNIFFFLNINSQFFKGSVLFFR